MMHRQPTTHRREPGFTLTEVLVVMVIIAIVMGLTLGGVAKMKENAKESHTRTLLTGLLGNEGMYENATEYAIQHNAALKGTIDWNNTIPMNEPGRAGTPGSLSDASIESNDDIAGGDNDFSGGDGSYTQADNDTDMQWANIYVERFIWAANQMPTVRKVLPSLGSGFDDTELDINGTPAGDGFLEVVDPWGNSVAYAASVSHSDGYTDDDFLPEHDSPFFASAGADQKWGRSMKRGEMTPAQWTTYKASDEYKFTRDNLYSFDLDRSAATRED